MKNLTSTLVALLVIGTAIVSGQDDIRTASGERLPTSPEQARTRNIESRMSDMNRMMSQSPEARRVRIKRLTKEERQRFEDATTPSDVDKLRYKDFLKQSNTGIIRLLTNSDCQTEKVVKIDGDCAGFVPDAWAYSFRLEDYAGRDFHDISYENNRLRTNSLLSQGILVDLRSEQVDDVGSDHPGIKYLSSFIPAQDRAGATIQFNDLTTGIRSGGFYYSNSLQLVVGNTYAFRSIAYRYGDKWASRFRGRNHEKLSKDEYKFTWFKFDKRSDSTYVLKVVSQDEDRGVTIVWKRLSKEKSPKIVFEEDEKLEDF